MLHTDLAKALYSLFQFYFCRARGGGRWIQIASIRLSSVRDAYKNLNNFAATGPFRTKLGW